MAGSAPSLADVGRHAGPLAGLVARLNRRDGSSRGKQSEQGGGHKTPPERARDASCASISRS